MATELYHFTVTLNGVTTHYRWANGTKLVLWGGFTWTPTLIDRSAIALSAGVTGDAFTINVGRDNPVANVFRLTPPDHAVTLTLYQESDVFYEQFWEGEVSKVSFDTSTARLTCTDSLSTSDRTIPIGRYSRGCRWALYSPQCGVDPQNYTHLVKVESLTPGLRLVVVRVQIDLGGGWAKGGYLKFDGEQRFVVESTGGHAVSPGVYEHHLTLDRWMPALVESAAVELVAGCGHNTTDCANKFNNIFRYGGFPLTPQRNPFES